MEYEGWFAEFKEALQTKDDTSLMWSISRAVRASFIQFMQFINECIGACLLPLRW